MHLRFYFAMLVLVASGVLAAGQTTGAKLKGIIIANEIGGPPLGGITIAAGDDANPTASDPIKGTFTFVFPKKRPGQTAHIYVKTEGYAVVNDVQLEVNLPDDPDSHPLTIVVCKSPLQEEMRSRFYRVKGNQAIDTGYTKRIKELEDRHMADAASIEQLTKERDQAKAAASNAAEEFAKLDFNKTSELYRRAMQTFLAGDVQSAVQLLDEEKLTRQLKAANEKENAAKGEKEQVTQAWLLRGRLLTLQFRFDEAERALKRAIDASPDNFKVNFAHASFNQSLNHFLLAEEGYKRCLELARMSRNEGYRALTLNNLGNLDRAQNRMNEARQHFEEALRIFNELTRKNPDIYLPQVGATLGNLGNLDRAEKRMDEARQHFEEALWIFNELARKNPDTYLTEVGGTLGNLAILAADQNRMEEARQHLYEATKIYTELAQKNPDTYRPHLAMTLSNLGNLDYIQNRMQDAHQHLQEAFEIQQDLVQKNPDAYLRDLAITLGCLGNLDHDQGRMDEARRHDEEALKIYTGLAEKNPDAYRPDMAQALGNLEIVDRAQNRMDEARQHSEEALKIYKELAKKNPDAYLPSVAWTLNKVGVLDRAQNRMDESRKHYEQAAEIYEQVAQKNPDMYLPEVARTLCNLGSLDRAQNRLDDARQHYHQALNIYQNFASRDSSFQDAITTVKNILKEVDGEQ
jgi:tetratricopeptide (TPR) repeat protein